MPIYKFPCFASSDVPEIINQVPQGFFSVIMWLSNMYCYSGHFQFQSLKNWLWVLFFYPQRKRSWEALSFWTGVLLTKLKCPLFVTVLSSDSLFHESLWQFVWCVCAQLCLTLYNSMNFSPPGSSVYGVVQARILEWVAISFSRGPFWPKDWTHVYCTDRQILHCWATIKAA